MRVALTPEEWRKLRAWAAEEATSMEHMVEQIVSHELESKPRRGFL